MTEHRLHPRKSFQIPVAFQLAGGELIEADCRDISLGGMFIETTTMPPYGAELVVYMALPGLGETSVKAIVRWTKKGEGMGVQFGTMGARETHALVAMLQST